MQIHHLSPDYAVSPQISPEDVAAIVQAGFAGVICNRPDTEVPHALRADALRHAVEAAGLRFEELPLTHQTMTSDNIAKQVELAKACNGPVLAYCASGTRCSVVWAISQVGHMSVDHILQKARSAGYNLEGLRPTLSSMALSAEI